MKKQKFRSGVIGCGRIGSQLEKDVLRGKPCSHAGGYNAHPEVDLVAGCDIAPDQLEIFKNQWEGVKTFTDIQELLSEKLDIVSIAVWTENHFKVLREVVKSPTIKVIVIEKPIASTVRQASKIVRLCEEHGKKLVVYHVRQWDSFYIKAKELIEEGKLGKIKTVFAQTLSGRPPKLPRKKYIGGAFFHDGTHLIDMLRYLCGDVSKIERADIKRPWGKDYIETEVHAQMRMKGGAKAFVEGSGSRNYFSFRLDIQGTHGRILIGNDVKKLWLTEESKRYTGFKELEEHPFEVEPINSHLNCVNNIVDHLKNNAPLLSTGHDGLETLRILTKTYRFADTN